MKKGFTLSELLLSLIIVGVIAVLTIPVLLNNVSNKTFATQVKNMSAIIEQLAQDELLTNKTRDLSDTDFGDPEELLTEKHFAIVKSCSSDDSLTDCWKTGGGDAEVSYKNLDNDAYAITAGDTVVLKNGVMLKYTLTADSDKTIGMFVFDVNGNDKPNILGRDLFGFLITPKGQLVDASVNSNNDDKIASCKSGDDVSWCYGALVENGWKIDY